MVSFTYCLKPNLCLWQPLPRFTFLPNLSKLGVLLFQESWLLSAACKYCTLSGMLWVVQNTGPYLSSKQRLLQSLMLCSWCLLYLHWCSSVKQPAKPPRRVNSNPGPNKDAFICVLHHVMRHTQWRGITGNPAFVIVEQPRSRKWSWIDRVNDFFANLKVVCPAAVLRMRWLCPNPEVLVQCWAEETTLRNSSLWASMLLIRGAWASMRSTWNFPSI